MSRRNRPAYGRPDGAPALPVAEPSAPAALAPSVAAPVVLSPVVAPSSAEASLRAEVEALKAQLTALGSPAPSPGGRNVCRVGWCSIHYAGRDYRPGDLFPFDLAKPPADVAPGFVESLAEGVHYAWTAE